MNAPESPGASTLGRLTAIGITKIEFAQRAGIDRGTLDRALTDDAKVSERTWAKINRVLDELEDEIGMAENGSLVTTVVEIDGGRITVKGHPEEVAAAVRGILYPTSPS